MPTSARSPDVVIVGAGIIGVATAIELRARGAAVVVIDRGPIPHPDAASTDISKLVRADYGKDVFYTEMMEEALPLWRGWNERFGPLFHETGLLVMSRAALEPGGFEGDSFQLLTARGWPLERLDARSIAERFPAWRPGVFVDGYFNPKGGWAASGRVVSALLGEALRLGVRVREDVRVRPLASDGPVRGVVTEDGEELSAGCVVVCAGAFTPVVVPELAPCLTPVAQPVMHFHGALPEPFVPWAADIATTGWYGFPAQAGVVKVANHGRGRPIDPAAPRTVDDAWLARFRSFFDEALPALSTAPHAASRLCLYCDTFDGDFFIDRHPTRDGLVVAAGGSGHAFKFAPLLGRFAADRVTASAGVSPAEPALRARFRWRERGALRCEEARHT